MFEQSRIRNGCKEWRQLPQGYRPLGVDDVIAPGDVMQLNPEWFSEYKAGLLIGTMPAHRNWFRLDPTLAAQTPPAARTAESIVAEANALARKISINTGHTAPDGHRFDLGEKDWEINAWQSAVVAYDTLTGVDVLQAVSELLLAEAA